MTHAARGMTHAARGMTHAARGMTRRVKSPQTASDDRFRRPAPLTLSTAHRGFAQTINCSRSRFSFFESGTTASESVVHDKVELKRALRLTPISSAASVVGELANFVVAVDSLRPALELYT